MSVTDPTDIFPPDTSVQDNPVPAADPAFVPDPAPAEATTPTEGTAPAEATTPAEAVTPTPAGSTPFEQEQAKAADLASTTASEPVLVPSAPVTDTQSTTSLASVMNRDVSTIFADVDATELGKRVVSFFQHVIGYVEDAKSIMDMLNKSK